MTAVCGCCEPSISSTPLQVKNRPELSAIAYRIGTYASFREAMLSAIAGSPELASLTTRQSNDYAITLLELWAVVADVLTFYQERYANEAFLRPARMRESVIRLASLIDYHLRPGVAAQALLAFTLEEGRILDLPVDLKVQSVPEQGEQPQVFETIEAITADARLNRLRIFPQPSSATGPLAYSQSTAILGRLNGPVIAAALAPGGTVVLFDDGSTSTVEEKKVDSLVAEDDQMVLAWTLPIKKESGWSGTSKGFKYRRTFRKFGYNSHTQFMTPSSSGSPQRITWSLTTLSDADFQCSAGNVIQLDGRYEDLSVGQKLLIADTDDNGKSTLVTIRAIKQVNATFGSVTDTVTELDVEPDLATVTMVPETTDRRKVIIYELQGSSIEFWDSRYPKKLSGDTVYLPGKKVVDDGDEGVEIGRTIERGDFKPGVILHLKEFEIGRSVLLAGGDGQPLAAKIKAAPTTAPASAVEGQFCHLVLPLEIDGTLDLDTATAVMLGNVALSSHGETVPGEIVGNGDASMKFQWMPLKKSPLTYLPGTGPGGVESSLELRVNNVCWKEVPGLFGQPSTAQVYAVRTADDGTTTVQFGDGTTGAVPPSGRGNVTATYRVGASLKGRVTASALTTLLGKPAGLSSVDNPLPAEGGADAETLELARQNAPRTVRTFGRAVSLRDFEDLVMASGEVAKALATWAWDGLDRAIHLTIASQEGGTFSLQDRKRLGRAMRSARDPNYRLFIENYANVFIILRAAVSVDPDHDQAKVLQAVREAVLTALSFDNLRLGQPIHLSELYRVTQDVEGILFVDIDELGFKRPAGMSNVDFQLCLASRGVTFLPDGSAAPVQGHLRIFQARPDPDNAGVILPAELAAIESQTQDLTVNVKES